MIGSRLAERIDALLPQTQCTRCGYPTCATYAEAVACGAADINRCPPGGADGVITLARLLGREPKPLDPAYGAEAPPVVALIDEDICIGCTKCIQACPVDAIVGAAKRMHTIIAAECTGCALCLPPCPVDCIALPSISDRPLPRAQVLERATRARKRFEAREARHTRATGSSRCSAVVPGATPDTHPAPPDPFLEREGSKVTAEMEGSKGVATSPMPSGTIGRGSHPISRSAVLDAIARGKARRRPKDPAAR